MTEAQKRAKTNYRKKSNRTYIDFYPTEAELWEHLNKQPKKQTYIKDLIRKDLNQDMANIVRCKDCIHYTYISPDFGGECGCFSGEDRLFSPNPNEYCSKGEAKTKADTFASDVAKTAARAERETALTQVKTMMESHERWKANHPRPEHRKKDE